VGKLGKVQGRRRGCDLTALGQKEGISAIKDNSQRQSCKIIETFKGVSLKKRAAGRTTVKYAGGVVPLSMANSKPCVNM
jgi:hypothetical protein